MKIFWQSIKEQLILWLAGRDSWLINVDIYTPTENTQHCLSIDKKRVYLMNVNIHGIPHNSNACIKAR
jgi:hypothetical protein